MSTEFCSKCQENHPGKPCDFKDGECSETVSLIDLDPKISNIRMHPEMHRHSYNDLVNCCMVDGILSAALLQAHEQSMGRDGVLRCDVIEGPCSCGAWHSGNN